MEEKNQKKKLLSPNEIAKLRMSKAPGNVMETLRPRLKEPDPDDIERRLKNVPEKYKDYVRSYLAVNLALM